VVNRGQVLALLISVHAFLMLKPYIGLKIVGWLGIVMTFMGLSGLYLWWPKKGQWRRAFLVRRGARGCLSISICIMRPASGHLPCSS